MRALIQVKFMTQGELAALLNDMSLEEKINQLNQLSGDFFTEDSIATGPMAQMGMTSENIDFAGSALGIIGAEKTREIQKKQIEKQPHKIPMLFMLDVINGFRTIYPIPLAQGASFDPELSEKCAHMAAKEASASGIHVTFSPMCDLVRDARWGRVMESTGEDPYLNGLFAEAMVKGYQGDCLSDSGNIAACVKHFAGYGAPDAGRDYNTVELSQHTLREFYLPAYEKGVEAGAELVMASFNTIEGIPASGNKWLLKKVLREEMKFQGVVISDWSAIEEMICHGYCADRREAAICSLNAGIDIDMMSGIYAEKLKELVRNGKVDEKHIDDAVMRILKLKNKLGLFENPYKDADKEAEKKWILCKEHRKLAREAARKSFVLLKNEGILPVDQKKKTAYIGPYVNRRNMMGSWSLFGNENDSMTLKEALLESSLGKNAVFCDGSPMLDPDMELEGFDESVKEICSEEMIRSKFAEAIEIARDVETVVLALGEDRLQSGEATSNGTIQIPKIQMELLEEVSRVNENIAVILFCGRPLDIREITKKAKSVLVVWMPGTEGAHAIADVLEGSYNPSGKLPMSFPYSVGQVPVHYNEYSTGRPHVKGKDKDRFRSKYMDIPNQPLYPFGYGLSYTEFEIGKVCLDKTSMTPEDAITASVIIRNIGKRIGEETLQLYIHDVSASVVRPVKELKAFKKIALKPGESRKIDFQVTNNMLCFISENACYESEKGKFEVFIGNSSETVNKAEFELI